MESLRDSYPALHTLLLSTPATLDNQSNSESNIGFIEGSSAYAHAAGGRGGRGSKGGGGGKEGSDMTTADYLGVAAGEGQSNHMDMLASSLHTEEAASLADSVGAALDWLRQHLAGVYAYMVLYGVVLYVVGVCVCCGCVCLYGVVYVYVVYVCCFR